MQIISTIHVNGLAYEGEAEATYTAHVGDQWRGFHVGTTGDALNLLQFGSEPKQIHGIRNMRSEIERILRRIQDGQLDAQEILIRIQGHAQ